MTAKTLDERLQDLFIVEDQFGGAIVECLPNGQLSEVTSSDAWAARVKAWCRQNGHAFQSTAELEAFLKTRVPERR